MGKSMNARGLTPRQVARLYGFPRGLDGRGQTVGIIALGGGFRRADMTGYFRRLRLPRPRISEVRVGGAVNDPDDAAAGEVTGDVQTVGALVPRARLVVYFAPNTPEGFLAAVTRAVRDRRHRPSVLSVSWGLAEGHWRRRTLRRFDDVLREAARRGIAVCVSSGDSGRLPQPRDRKPGVCFPASSPHVLACGGTTLLGSRPGRLRERAWKDREGASGGGVSAILPRPPWQHRLAHVGRGRGRAVPDVAASADPECGYRVYLRGRWVTGAGTSAAAPLWAGLIAQINQRVGRRVGLIAPFLYEEHHRLVELGALRPITGSESHAGRDRHAWNRHTGLGAPHGARLTAALADWPGTQLEPPQHERSVRR